MTEKKLFGKYHDIILMIIGFALTSVVGSFIAHNYQERQWEKEAEFQKREWDRQNEVQLRQKQSEQAELVYKELSEVLDKTVMLAFKAKVVMTESGEGDAELGFKKYNFALKEYKLSYDKLLATYRSSMYLVDHYFGDEMKYIFEDIIINYYEDLDEKMDIYEPNALIFSGLGEIGDCFEQNSLFYIKMLNAIRDQNIGSFLKEEPESVPEE